MKDDVILNKVATIERCIARVKEEYLHSEEAFLTNYTKQDAIILNLQRAIEAALDMGMYVVRIRKLGLPQDSREVFSMLEEAKIIPMALSKKLQAMVGFRNIAIHEYKRLNLEIIKAILEKNLEDLLALNRYLIQYNDRK